MACRFFSGVGDVVLDPFVGSGTTVVTAIRTGRNYIGFDTCAEYCELARERAAGAVDELLLEAIEQ
jgi:site-specific DNA-methyltransferase (adenine-specific)